MKQQFYYLIGAILLVLFMFIVLVCVPFIAIGEFANFIATKIMRSGDKIMEWQKEKERAK